MSDSKRMTLYRRILRKILPRTTLLLFGDREGFAGAEACVVWLGREWLHQEVEFRKWRGGPLEWESADGK